MLNKNTLLIYLTLPGSFPASLKRTPECAPLVQCWTNCLFVALALLRYLRELNLEGNQLVALPTGMLRLRHLRHLCVRNNFLHPLFWKDNSKNTPSVRTAGGGGVASRLQLLFSF